MQEVKVRVAVAVDADGNWYAIGGRDLDELEALQEAINNVGSWEGQLSTYILENIVACPAPFVVESNVQQTLAEEQFIAARKNFEAEAAALVKMRETYEYLIRTKAKQSDTSH